MRKRAFVAAFTAAALSIAALSGCGNNSSKTTETTAKAETEAADGAQESAEEGSASEAAETTEKDKKDLREVNVVLDWYPNAIHTFLYTAIERGYYEEEGLDVQIRFPSNANDALSMVAAGKAEIGMYYQQDLIQASSKPESADSFRGCYRTVSVKHHSFPEGQKYHQTEGHGRKDHRLRRYRVK